MNKICLGFVKTCLEAFLGFLVETKRKAYTKLTVVICCQIFAKRSVAPSSGLWTGSGGEMLLRPPFAAEAGVLQVCNLIYFFCILPPRWWGPPGLQVHNFKSGSAFLVFSISLFIKTLRRLMVN